MAHKCGGSLREDVGRVGHTQTGPGRGWVWPCRSSLTDRPDLAPSPGPGRPSLGLSELHQRFRWCSSKKPSWDGCRKTWEVLLNPGPTPKMPPPPFQLKVRIGLKVSLAQTGQGICYFDYADAASLGSQSHATILAPT